MAINTIIAKTKSAVTTPVEFTVTGPFFLHTFAFLPTEIARVVRLNWPSSGDNEPVRGDDKAYPNMIFYDLPAGTYGAIKGATEREGAVGWESKD